MVELDEKLRKVLDVIQEAGLKMNLKKCVWQVPVLIILGHRFSMEGVRPDPDKLKVIVEMSAPPTDRELQRIRAMISYIGMFLPNSATIANDLLKKDVQSSWGPMQKKSLDEVKQTLVNATILAFQNPQKPITISSVTKTHEIYSWWVACKVL